MSSSKRSYRVARRMSATVLVACGCTAGCASGGGGQEDGGEIESVEIQVHNNLVNPTTVSIVIVTEDGSEQVLGQVAANRSVTFSFRPSFPSNQHQLVAQPTAGAAIRSTPFTLVGVTALNWGLASNSVRMERARSPG